MGNKGSVQDKPDIVLQDGGEVVGAVGVSGSTEDDDSEVSRAGVAAFAAARSGA